MRAGLEDRITYGRSIRERALRLVDDHGAAAAARAVRAAEAPGTPEVERLFWHAVAARVARLERATPMLPAIARAGRPAG